MADQMVPTGGNSGLSDSLGNLGSLLNKAMNIEDAPSEVSAQVETPVVEAVAPVVEQTPVITTTPQVAEQESIWDPPAGTKVRIKLDGKDEVVSVDDFRNSLQREAVFTQRMQQLASQRRQAEEELANKWAQLQMQAQLIQQQMTQQPKQPTVLEQLQELANQQNTRKPKPDEMVTHGEVEQTLQSKLSELGKKFEELQTKSQKDSDEKIAQAIYALQRQAQADHFTAGLQKVLAKPELQILQKVNPMPGYVEAVVRHELAKMDVQSPEQGFQFAEMIARQWADNVNKNVIGQQKQEAATKAQERLEPNTSGSAPGPKKPQYETIFRKDGTVNFGALSQRAHAMMDQLDA